MGEITQIIETHSGGTCYQTERFTLDHFIPPEYQDKDEVFDSNKLFETANKAKENIPLKLNGSVCSLFSYFLDGSRRVYKIFDFGSTDGKFLPIVAGQIGVAVCYRHHQKLKKQEIIRENVIAVPDRMGDDFEKIAQEIKQLKLPKDKKYNLSIDQILKYTIKLKPDRPFENLATAKIQVRMMERELELVRKMVHSNQLKTDQMLIVDGSLQFSSVRDEDTIFQNVIGISKSFNPNLQGVLKSKSKHIGQYLINLEFGERTPVFVYEAENKKNRKIKIGAWYLRIHPRKKLKKPLDGVIKVEKIATTRKEKENGFDTDMINEISKSILLERNVTCYGNDERWTNHIYPIYLTELLLKNSFASDTFFLSLF